ncbi:Putative ribonuclease H protein At1g65750, partial [Linum perenne]
MRIRNFVWGTTAEERKVSLVAWENICLPKEKGGLGLKMARQLNRAYLTKLAFLFFKDKERLWVEAGMRLDDFVDTSKPEFDVSCTVADMTMEDGGWNFELLENLLQPEMVDLVAGMAPPRPNRGDEDWIWGREDSGKFTIKSAYNLICQTEEIPTLAIWKTIWRWDGPNRIRHFLWLAARNRLLTNESRKHRGMSQRRIEVSWQAGPHDWVTLNTDGSVRGPQGRAAAGGLFHDASGNCLHAYTVNLGICSITRAEICGALEGIRRAWEAGYRRIEVQMDSKAAVAILLNSESGSSHQYTLEVLEFQDWLHRDWEVKLIHIYREANHAADYLANLGHNTIRGTHNVEISDCNLAYFVRHDCL